MSRGRYVALVAGASATIALASSCFIEGFVLVETTPIQPGDGGVGGAEADADGDADPTCGHATWPSPPEDADPGSDTVDVVLAVSGIDFGESATDGTVIGYDLDNYCTCQGEGPSCNEPEWATADHCDGPAGRDNAWASIFAAAIMFEPSLSSEAISAEVQQGGFTMLVRVHRYNGMPNDDSVTVAIYASPGLDTDPCQPPDSMPAWDGDDRWPVVYSSFAGSGGGAGVGGGGGGVPIDCSSGANVPPGYDFDQPRFVDPQAYVTDSVVVANLPDVEMILAADSGSNVKLTAGFLTGRLEEGSGVGEWILRDGLLVGRWQVNDVFRSLGAMVTGGGDTVCTDDTIYPLIKSAVCKFPDIASTLGGPTTPCDAISFAMGFEAEPARFGSVYFPSAPVAPCPPETDPANDTCEDTI